MTVFSDDESETYGHGVEERETWGGTGGQSKQLEKWQLLGSDVGQRQSLPRRAPLTTSAEARQRKPRRERYNIVAGVPRECAII